MTERGCVERRMYVAGAWVTAEGGRTYSIANPATGEPLADVPFASPADVDTTASLAADACVAWGRTSLDHRVAVLEEVARRLRENADALALTDALELGSPVRAMRADVLSAIERIHYFCGIVRELRGECMGNSEQQLHYTLRQPFGVAACLVAFNHPLKFAVVKAMPALLMGNAVIIKPAEQTPLSALDLAELVGGLFPTGVFNVLTGDGPETGAALVHHPSIRRIGLIGGVETGRQVLRAAAEGIKTVTLELGGKNPIIVCPDADLDAAIEGIVAGMNFTRNQGQSCGSTSRLFLHGGAREYVLPRLLERVRRIRPGLPTEPQTEMGCLVSREHLARVMGYIDGAQKEGAVLLTGGRPPDDPRLARGCFLEPTILDRVTPTMTVAREEVFGPVLSVLTWTDEETLIGCVNDVIYGLTASIWTRDLATAHRLASRVEAGYVWINGASRHYTGLPFGGWKQSGLGRAEHMEELLSYTQTKAVTLHL